MTNNFSLNYSVQHCENISGTINIPGDKSISHRSIMLGAIAEGITKVSGFLEGADCLATMNAFKAMGVDIEGPTEGELTIHGVGLHGLKTPKNTLDLGNSGTSIRLLSGLLAGQSFSSTVNGDASLQQRPMGRVVNPLIDMGAHITMAKGGRPPLQIQGGQTLQGFTYQMPMASAQVKSCLLLAGLYAKGDTAVIEPAPTRDHTERMLTGFGVDIQREGAVVKLRASQQLTATQVQVPGDISSAAFFIVAATIIPNSNLILKNVGINPTRIGCINILKAMGANIKLINEGEVCGEPVADLQVQSAELRGIEIPQDQIPLAIDEFPIIFIAAACAKGVTTLKGAEELRVKESDRIHSMAVGLKSLGIYCEEFPDGIAIHGGEFQGGEVDSQNDHRIAMAFSIAGAVAKEKIIIKNCKNVDTSFPGFVELATAVGMNIYCSP